MKIQKSVNVGLKTHYSDTFVIFQISILEFVKLDKCEQNKKKRKRFWTIMPYLDIFKLKFEKGIVIFEISAPEHFKI